jgi:hypothetical protein
MLVILHFIITIGSLIRKQDSSAPIHFGTLEKDSSAPRYFGTKKVRYRDKSAPHFLSNKRDYLFKIRSTKVEKNHHDRLNAIKT